MKIDGFKNIQQVGKGGFGEVFKATEELLGKEVAIKRLYSSELTDRDSVLN